MSWTRLLGSEVRGSFLFRLGVPLVIVGVVVSQSVASPGLFVWEDRAAAAITSLAVLVPLITGSLFLTPSESAERVSARCGGSRGTPGRGRYRSFCWRRRFLPR